jgi:hypothetical protein
MTAAVAAAIAGIDESAWQAIEYPHAITETDPDTGHQHLVSDAQVADTAFTAFTGRRVREQVTCRLVVRRVKRLQPVWPPTAASRVSCSPRGATTRSSPTAP